MSHQITDGPEDWLKTPDDFEYVLAMMDAGVDCQWINLTRAEFIALKQHLASMRQPAKPKLGKLPPNVVAMPPRAGVTSSPAPDAN
jgi:hypothetical protein